MPDSNKNIDLLIEEIKKGNKKAFEELYDNYSEALYGVILKIVQSEELACDLLQDTFIKIWKKFPTYDSNKSTLFTWMLNIARNTAIDKYRILKKRNDQSIQTSASDVGIGNDSRLINSTDNIGIPELVNSLEEEYKRTIEYLYYRGYTQQEMADETNTPLGTIKTRARSALNKLRKLTK